MGGDDEGYDPMTLAGGLHRGVTYKVDASSRGVGPQAGPVRVAQAGPKQLLPTFAEKVAADVRAAQARADQLAAELRPFYSARFRRVTSRGKAQHSPGDAVPIKVLSRGAFEASGDVFDRENLEDERARITQWAPYYALQRLSSPGSPFTPPAKITTAIRLSRDALEFIKPEGSKSKRMLAGFFSHVRDTLFVRADQVDVGVLAHELCHAYASKQWNEMIIALQMQTASIKLATFSEMSTLGFYLDEGVTSALAQVVLDDWYTSSASGGAPRPVTPPSGKVGYLPAVLATGESFIASIDGGLGVPGANTFVSYFGGDLDFTIDEAAPLNTDVRCGRRKSDKLVNLL